MAINFIASIFLARLLTPHEIGIFSIAYVFSGLLRTIREMGLGSYIVQEQELTPARFRTAFGISILIAFATAGILGLLAGYAGEFYREPGITQAIYVIAASFLLVPFGATTLSFLRRELRFVDIAVIETVSTVVQNSSAVTLAWLGYGFMSLAWSSLLGILASVLMVLFYRPKSIPWLPSISEWRRVLSFSSFVSGSSLINYINVSASDLVLGRMLNVSSVAIFNRANSLSEMIGPLIMKAASAVSLPYFAEKKRGGGELLSAFVRTSTLLSVISLPIYFVIMITADPLIRVLYGSQWEGSIGVLQWLCLAAMLRMPLAMTTHVMTAIGEVRQLFVLDIKSLLLKLLFVIIGASYSLDIVAICYCIATGLTFCMRFNTLRNYVELGYGDIWKILKYSMLPMFFSGIGPLIIVMNDGDLYFLLFASFLLAVIGWIASVLAIDNPMGREIILIYDKLRGLKIRL